MTTGSIQTTLERLRAQGTDDAHVEVKTSAKKLSSDVWDSVSAFANTSGGIIVLGLSEREGFVPPVAGFDIDAVRDQFVEGIGSGSVHGVRLTNPPSYGVSREWVDDAPVLVMRIAANPPGSRPCFVTAKGLPGGAYKRVDDKDIKLSATEVFEMQHELVASEADQQIIDDADESDLDSDVLTRLIDRRRDSRALHGAKGRPMQLARLNVLDKRGGVRLAGLLTTGIYPQQFYPRLLVDVTVHAGNEKSLPGSGPRFIDRVECTGNIVDVVGDAVAAVTRNLRTYSVIEEAGRREVPEIPGIVLREAIANAVLHREYSPMFVGRPVVIDVYADRVEIVSPGGLWGGMTIDNLDAGISNSRNQMLMPLMQHVAPEGRAEFTVEGQGSGVRLMINEMEAHALERPKFSVTPDQVKVTLARHGAEIPEHRDWLRQLTDRDLDSHEDAILLIARRQGEVSVDSARTALRVDSDEARSILMALRDEGVLRSMGGESYALAGGSRLPNDDDAELLRGLAGKTPQTIHEIVEWSGLSLGAARLRLRRLVAEGWIRATAPPQSRHRKYVLHGDVAD